MSRTGTLNWQKCPWRSSLQLVRLTVTLVLAMSCSEAASADTLETDTPAGSKAKNPAAIGYGNLPADFSAPIASMDVHGELPRWLNGSLYRNGPAWWNEQRLNHWFFGLAMVHAFHISDGKISYRNQYLRTSVYNQFLVSDQCSDEQQHPSQSHMMSQDEGTQPAKQECNRGEKSEPESINTAVTIRRVAGHLLANAGSMSSNEFHAEDLSTLHAPFSFQDDMQLFRSSSHAHTDLDGTIVHFYYIDGPQPAYQFYTIAAGTMSRQRLGAPLQVNNAANAPVFMHSFALTEHYAILSEIPAFLAMDFHQAKFFPTWNAKWRIVNRQTGEELDIQLESAGFMMYHHINAYEDINENGEAEIVVDVASFPDMDSLQAMFIDSLINRPEELMDSFYRGAPHRYRLPLSPEKRGTLVQGEKLWDGPIELPTIAYEQYNTKKYTYFYGISATEGKSVFVDRLVKVDVDAASRQGNSNGALSASWEADNCYPGEPVFVSRSQSAAEDDGVILSLVLNAAEEHSFLLVLDGKSFTEIATVPLTYAVPFGFHGRHYFNTTATASE
eukprot:scpid39635/ scgid21631/ Beta,beta-carotene 9&apos; B-diox-II; Beta-carotene dioxygenase 2